MPELSVTQTITTIERMTTADLRHRLLDLRVKVWEEPEGIALWQISIVRLTKDRWLLSTTVAHAIAEANTSGLT